MLLAKLTSIHLIYLTTFAVFRPLYSSGLDCKDAQTDIALGWIELEGRFPTLKWNWINQTWILCFRAQILLLLECGSGSGFTFDHEIKVMSVSHDHIKCEGIDVRDYPREYFAFRSWNHRKDGDIRTIQLVKVENPINESELVSMTFSTRCASPGQTTFRNILLLFYICSLCWCK